MPLPAGADTVSEIDWDDPAVVAVVSVVVTLADPVVGAATVEKAGYSAVEKSLSVRRTQDGNAKDPMAVCQLNVPLVGMYWFVYQNVQPSDGSDAIDE